MSTDVSTHNIIHPYVGYTFVNHGGESVQIVEYNDEYESYVTTEGTFMTAEDIEAASRLAAKQASATYKATERYGYKWMDAKGYFHENAEPTKVQLMQIEIDSLKAKLEESKNVWKKMMEHFK